MSTPHDTRGPSPSLRTTLRCTLKTLQTSARFLIAQRRGGGTMDTADQLLREWAQTVMRLSRCTLTSGGQAHITPGASYVIMSNHASFFDIPALYGAYPGRLRMVGKAELFKVPIWGPAMHEAGMVAIDRGDRSAAIAQLAEAEALLTGGTSVWISPEGTRTTTGALSPFKKGGFHVAANMGVPILPAYIRGSGEVMPPDAFKITPGGHIHVQFGEPIPPAAAGAEGLSAVMARVEGAIRALGSGPR